MAAATLTYDALKSQIRQRKLAPVYVLHGEEGYFIDELVKEFEDVVPEADKEFNQYILYAPQIEAGKVMDLCQRYPMMAERQVVILKEAQAVRADQINRLHKYVLNPSPTTVFVIVFRGETAKGKDLVAAAKKNAVVFESKKVRDYQLPVHISNYIKDKGMTADPKAVEMLRDYIGSDLSHMFNELDKLYTILGKGACVTPEAIERNIGISKEFNSTELIDALTIKDAAKAMRIAAYFEANPKANPLPPVTATIFNFFSNILIAYYAKDKSDQGLMAALNLKNPYPLKRINAAMRYYNAFQVIEAIWVLRQFDCQSKGNGSRQNCYLLFRDLIFHLLTARGNLGI